MFGLIYTLIAGIFYTGSYVKTSFEDFNEKIDAQVKGNYKYIDSKLYIWKAHLLNIKIKQYG